MQEGVFSHPEAERLMQDLAMELGAVKGKKTYGYLPKWLKKKVNEIVDEMERIPVVTECYDKWLELQQQVDSYYKDRQRQRKKLSEEKEFTAIKNAVIREAERIRLGEFTFEDDGIEQANEPEEFDWPSESIWELYQIITDESIPMDKRDEVVRRMEHLAESGDPDAQYTMGRLCRDGPLLIPDWFHAARWFERATQQGNADAQYALGKLLLSGDPELWNPEAGMSWLESAAGNGNSWAAYRLGKEYLSAVNVDRNEEKAATFFLLAAEAGNLYAQYALGKLLLSGNGVPKNKADALFWMQEAADRGHRFAQLFLDRQDSLRPPSVLLSVTQLLYHIGNIFQERTPMPPVPGGMQLDRKRMQELREKRIALGHKANDHEDERNNRYMQTM